MLWAEIEESWGITRGLQAIPSGKKTGRLIVFFGRRPWVPQYSRNFDKWNVLITSSSKPATKKLSDQNTQLATHIVIFIMSLFACFLVFVFAALFFVVIVKKYLAGAVPQLKSF